MSRRLRRGLMLSMGIVCLLQPAAAGRVDQQGEAALLAMLRTQPDQIQPYLSLGAIYYAERQYDEAERVLMRGLSLVRDRAKSRPQLPSPAMAAFAVSPLRAGADVPVPVRMRDVAPEYPAAALDGRLGGTVWVEILIDERGRVSNETVSRSVPGLDDAALAAVRQWEFVPTLLGGVAKTVTMATRVTFIPETVTTVPQNARRQLVPVLGLVRRSFEQGAFADAQAVLESVIAAVVRERGEPRADPTRAITTGRTTSAWPIRAGRDFSVPPRTKDARPVFPPDRVGQGPGGLATFDFLIDPGGKVTNLRRVGLADPVFEQASRQAIEQWEFEPTVLGGIAVPVGMMVTFNFSQTGAVEEVVRVGGDLQEPRKLHDVRPIYPREAQQNRQSGVAVLESVIDIQGKVTELRVLKSGGDALDRAAIAAVRQWVYEPTILAGVPVPVVMTITVSFNVR